MNMDIWNKLWRGGLDSPVAVGKTVYGFKRGARDICGVALLGLLAACSGTDTDFDATGIFESTEVIVSSEANGKIMALNLEEGDLLEQGQQVGYVDSVQLYLKKCQLEAQVRSIGSRRADVAKQVAATREQIAKAELERKRSLNLLAQNAGTQKQVDDVESQLAVLKKQLEAQLSTLNLGNQGVTEEGDAAEIQIRQIEDQLEKCRIVSPISGTVLTKYAVTSPRSAYFVSTDEVCRTGRSDGPRQTLVQSGGHEACLFAGVCERRPTLYSKTGANGESLCRLRGGRP